jgi:hypothetical protein
MAFVSNKSGKMGGSATTNQDGHRSYSTEWQLCFDNINDGEQAALAQLPQVRTVYPGDGKAKLVSKNVSFDRKLEHYIFYKGTCQYETNTEEWENPLQMPAIIKWGVSTFTKGLEKDKDGTAILNKAGDHYAQTPQIEDCRDVISVTINQAVNPKSIAPLFRNRVNQAAWNGYAARTVLCRGIEISERKSFLTPADTQVYYWEVNYLFEINLDTWKVEILEQGYREKKAGKLVDIMVLDEDGNPTEERASFPILLTDAGVAQMTDPKVPVFTSWNVRKEADFSLFNITL